jgi:hypothetical protein
MSGKIGFVGVLEMRKDWFCGCPGNVGVLEMWEMCGNVWKCGRGAEM